MDKEKRRKKKVKKTKNILASQIKKAKVVFQIGHPLEEGGGEIKDLTFIKKICQLDADDISTFITYFKKFKFRSHYEEETFVCLILESKSQILTIYPGDLLIISEDGHINIINNDFFFEECDYFSLGQLAWGLYYILSKQ